MLALRRLRLSETFCNSGRGHYMNTHPSICIENRQEAIALLNKLIRGEKRKAKNHFHKVAVDFLKTVPLNGENELLQFL
jgi:hypothetical protein